MSDDQFVNEACDNGTAENFAETTNEIGVDFSNETNNKEETEKNDEIKENGNADNVKKANGNNKNYDKKNLQAECFRKVFVGSLNYTTTEESMREHFAKFGEIVDCVIMKESKSGKSRGFGFVTYLNQDMVNELMKNRPHKIDGRELETKRATPREEAGKPGAEMSTKKLFVGAIKEGMTEEHLKEYFGKYGKIEDCIVMKDKESGKPRGFGFVSFDDYDPIDKIVLEKNHTVNNQTVAVKKALPKDQTNGHQNGNNNMRGNNFNNNRGGGGRNNNGHMNNRGNNNNNGRFNNSNNGNGRFNNNNYNNDDFNSNNFNDNNGGFNSFASGNQNNNGFNGNNGNMPNNNGNSGNGMPGFNFALIAQKMLQAANMGNNGNGNGNNNFNGNQNGFNGNNQNGFNGNNMNGNRRGGGPIRANGRGGGNRSGPYQGKKN